DDRSQLTAPCIIAEWTDGDACEGCEHVECPFRREGEE
ncbi:unnamed protein product, partial [marine sediment metagenome]